jgi:hypothetical protein
MPRYVRILLRGQPHDNTLWADATLVFYLYSLTPSLVDEHNVNPFAAF